MAFTSVKLQQVQRINLSRDTVTYRSRFPNQQISVGFGILVNLKTMNHFYEAVFHKRKQLQSQLEKVDFVLCLVGSKQTSIVPSEYKYASSLAQEANFASGSALC